MHKINAGGFAVLHICRSLRKGAALSASMRKKRSGRERMKGSATIEAALVMPLFIYGYLAVMQLLWIVGAQMKIHEALYCAGEEMAKMAYAEMRQAGALKMAGMALFYGKLPGDYLKMAGVAGGIAGISLAGSRISEDLQEINLEAEFIAVNPFDIAGFSCKKYKQTLYLRGWTGTSQLHRRAGNQDDRKFHMVYITLYGEVYHERKSCAYLSLSIRTVEKKDVGQERNANHGKYQACARCCREKTEEILYVTDYGSAYHSDRNCSALTRGIMSVSLDAAGERKKCSKCGG